MGLGCPATEERALQVYVHHCIPIVLSHFEEQVIANNARVIDQDIEPSEAVNGLRDSILHGCIIGHIAGNRHRMSAEAINLLHPMLAAFQINIRQHNAGSILGQAQSRSGPNASPSPGNKSYTTIKSSHALLLPP